VGIRWGSGCDAGRACNGCSEQLSGVSLLATSKEPPLQADLRAARRAVLTQIGLLGPLRREMARCTLPHLQEAAAPVAGYLAKHGPLRASQLATALRLDMSVVSRHVSELVNAGYVERHVDESDRRAALLSLTPAGQAALDSALDRLDEHFRERFTDWDDADLLHLADSLQRLREELVPAACTAAPNEAA
jgi:DNA-binding MarR family transcriptional regulator